LKSEASSNTSLNAELFNNSSLISANMTDDSSMDYCFTPQYFHTAYEFWKCYLYLFPHDLGDNIFGIVCVVLIVSCNAYAILMLLTKAERLTIFDKIMAGHCLTDFVVGLFDGPFFQIINVFGYWPLSKWPAYLWTAYDAASVPIQCLHMLYITWARYRSIKAASTYQTELLLRRPIVVMSLIWLYSFAFYFSATFGLGESDFSYSYNVPANYMSFIFNVLNWFVPLTGILILAICILILLSRREKKRKAKRALTMKMGGMTVFNNQTFMGAPTPASDLKQSNRRRLIRLLSPGPQTKFMVTYFI
jgi:hypothetical protein